MLLAVAFAPLGMVPGWGGRIALVAVMLCVIATMVLWIIPDRLKWNDLAVSLWLALLWFLLGVQSPEPADVGLREVLILCGPGLLVWLMGLSGMLHRRHLRGQRFEASSAFLLVIWAMFFSTSWVMCINEQYDFHPQKMYAAEVTGSRVTVSKNAHHYYAELQYIDEDGMSQNACLKVKKERYDCLEIGEAVALTKHQGALSMPFYTGVFEQALE